MATKRAAKSTSSRKRAEPAAPAEQPAPSGPADPVPANPVPTREAHILAELLAQPARLEALRDRFNRQGRYKPTIEDLACARDIAEAVARALIIGNERSWKAIAEAWQVVRGARTLRDRVMRQVDAVASTIAQWNASKPHNAGRIRVGAARDANPLVLIHDLQRTLAHWDPAFAQLDLYTLRREISEARQGRGGKGGNSHIGACGVLAQLSVLCGANRARRLDPLTVEGQREVTRMNNRIGSYDSRARGPKKPAPGARSPRATRSQALPRE